MPSPLIDQDSDLVSYDVKVNGTSLNEAYFVYSIEVQRGVNRISTAEISVLDGNLSKEEFKILDTGIFKPGAEVTIEAGYHQKNEIIFKGMVVKTGVRIKEGRHSLSYIECADKAIKATMGRFSDYYLDKKDSDIINQVLGKHGLSKQVETTKVKHKEIIQYQSTDWDFVVSRAEVNGKIVMTDDNKVIVKEPKTGGPVLDVTFGTDIIKFNLNLDAHSQYKAVEASAWDMNTQKIIKSKSTEPNVNKQGDVTGKEMAGKMMSEDYKFHLTGPLEKNDLKEWANAKLLKSRFARIKGSITFQGHAKVKPDTIIKVKKIGKHFDGDAYISGVHHEIREGNWVTEATVGLDEDWFAETKPQVNAAAAAGLLPGINGMYIGKVKKMHDDPDGEIRVLVDVPVIKPSGDGVWARIANLYAGNKRGTFFMPEVDDEVVLSFLQGDPRFPIIVGSLYSKKNKPPYQPDSDNSIKAIVTKNDLKIIFEDKDKNIIVETPGGNTLILSDKDKKVILQNKMGGTNNTITMEGSGMTIESSGTIDIIAMRDVTIKSKTGKVTVDATTDAIVKAKMNFKASGNMNAEVNGTMSAKVSGMMTDVGGAGMTNVKGSLVRIN